MYLPGSGRSMVDCEHGPILSFTPPLLILRRMLLYFCIPTCIFILIFNICDPYLSRSDRLLCPFATIRLTNRERVSNRSQHPIFDYLIIGGLYLLTLILAAIHNPVLVFYLLFFFFFFGAFPFSSFLSLTGKTEWIISPF